MKKLVKSILAISTVAVFSLSFAINAYALFGGEDWTFQSGASSATLSSSGNMQNNFKTSIIPHTVSGTVTINTRISYKVLFTTKYGNVTSIINNYDWQRKQWDIGGSYKVDYKWSYYSGTGSTFVEVGYFDV